MVTLLQISLETVFPMKKPRFLIHQKQFFNI